MDLAEFHTSLQAPQALGNTLSIASTDPRDLMKLGIGPEIIEAARAGAVVLSIARFENYIKDIAGHFLDAYSRATPAITLSQLDVDLQLKLIKRNFSAASREKEYGAPIDKAVVIQSIQGHITRVVNDEVWAGEAIDTRSNPNAETVQEIFGLLGIPRAWESINQEFLPRWAQHQLNYPLHKSIPSPKNELTNIIGWRNICAHTGQSLQIGAREVEETLAYLTILSAALDKVLEDASNSSIRTLGSTPAPWA